MKELVGLTGLNRQTLHFYLRQGVLPPPVSGAGTRNARYSETHVALSGLVRELRDDAGLSLEAIRRRFEIAGYDPVAVRTGRASWQPLPVDDGPPLSAEELSERSLVPRPTIDALIGAGIIAAVGDGIPRYAPECIEVVLAARRLRNLGLENSELAAMAAPVSALSWLEVEALAASAAKERGDLEALVERVAPRFAAVGALVDALRRLAVAGALRRVTRVGARARAFAEEAVYVPSPMFVQRHGLEDALAGARALAGREGARAVMVGRLLLGLGRYDEAAEWLTRVPTEGALGAEALAYLGLARAISGPARSGLAAARQAVAIAPESPRAHAFLGVVLAFHAATTTGLAAATTVLQEAIAAAGRSRDYPPADAREDLEVRLARGRILAVLPDGGPGGVPDLITVLDSTAAPDSAAVNAAFDYPGARDVYRINTLFFLGIDAAGRDDEGQARRWLLECITLDPASNYAARAYERLGTLGHQIQGVAD